VPVSWPRALLLGTVAADLYTGYASLRRRARGYPGTVSPRDWTLQHRRGAARAFDTAVALGGLLIKAAQFASTRPDLLPAPYIHDLARLQDRVPPHPWPSIRATIAEELGGHPETVFATISERPMAAASLSQVHRARLRDGRRVAVKVQYHDISGLVREDLKALGFIVNTVARLEPAIRLQPIVDYLGATLPLELDYRREAAAMDELRQVLSHRDDIVIPEVISELSTERLLVMELMHGVRITDKAGMEAAGIDPAAVAHLLNDVYAEQLLKVGVLHGDPHPGNLLVQPGPKLVILDHGLTVRVPPPLAEALKEMTRAIFDGDSEALMAAAEKAGLQLGKRLEIATLLELIGVFLTGGGIGSAAEVARRVGISLGSVPVELILVGRALALLDGISRQLDREVDLPSIIASYS
jgi:predicted unusual protein kinase regulating ubiquinone biosynthesis (AarF/ABC1/UbiB family)